MTRNYNRTLIYSFYDLPQYLQAEILQDMEISDADSTSYVIVEEDEEKIPLGLDMFMRTEEKNNFTHGIYGMSYFSGYYLTLSRCGSEGVIAYKYF